MNVLREGERRETKKKKCVKRRITINNKRRKGYGQDESRENGGRGERGEK